MERPLPQPTHQYPRVKHLESRHNVSVASLYELLLPPGKRMAKFQVGSRKFDPKHVGYDPKKGGFELDTSLPGNRNTGHFYGTSMKDADRWALIEFLKTL